MQHVLRQSRSLGCADIHPGAHPVFRLSRSPSSDGPKEKAERRAKKPTGRAAGGQPGHPKHERPAWPAEKVNKRVVLRPKQCERCSSPLAGEDPEPHRHQLFELEDHPASRARNRDQNAVGPHEPTSMAALIEVAPPARARAPSPGLRPRATRRLRALHLGLHLFRGHRSLRDTASRRHFSASMHRFLRISPVVNTARTRDLTSLRAESYGVRTGVQSFRITGGRVI